MVTKNKPGGYFIQYGKRVNGRIKNNEQISTDVFQQIIYETLTKAYLSDMTFLNRIKYALFPKQNTKLLAMMGASKVAASFEIFAELDVKLNAEDEK